MSAADGSAAGGGKQSSFSTPEIPLVFDLPTVGQTPQPRLYCYGPGHGVLLGEIGTDSGVGILSTGFHGFECLLPSWSQYSFSYTQQYSISSSDHHNWVNWVNNSQFTSLMCLVFWGPCKSQVSSSRDLSPCPAFDGAVLGAATRRSVGRLEIERCRSPKSVLQL